MSASPTPDPLTPIAPPDPDQHPTGALRLDSGGAVEGLGAGVEVWCGSRGWKSLGDVRGALVMQHEGRLSVAVSFDLGVSPMRPPVEKDRS